MSSGGVLFQSSSVIQIGSTLLLFVEWPTIKLGQLVKFIARGQAVRCLGRTVALRITKYDFEVRDELGVVRAVRRWATK